MFEGVRNEEVITIASLCFPISTSVPEAFRDAIPTMRRKKGAVCLELRGKCSEGVGRQEIQTSLPLYHVMLQSQQARNNLESEACAIIKEVIKDVQSSQRVVREEA